MGERNRVVVQDIRWQSVRPYAIEIRRANPGDYAVLMTGAPDTRNGGQVVPRPVRPSDIAAVALDQPISAIPVLRIDSTMEFPASTPPDFRFHRGQHRLIVECRPDHMLTLEDFVGTLPAQPETFEAFGGVVSRTDILLRRFIAFVKKVDLQAVALLPCPHVTAVGCLHQHGLTCADRYHFNRLSNACTKREDGDCTFLSPCFNKAISEFIHYEWVRPANPLTFERIIQLPFDLELEVRRRWGGGSSTLTEAVRNLAAEVKDNVEYPAQWIRADLEDFNFRVIGRYDVVMIDRKHSPPPIWRVCSR